jgi:outer membrane protein OmpA-like peptidoglycan-associated protein
MRRFFLFVFALILTTSAFSKDNDFSRWSITPEYGYNYFDGDINQNIFKVIPSSLQNITFGGTVEYAMTPIWGLSLDGYYFPLRAQSNTPTPIYINSNLVTTDLNVTLNFTRWIFPQSKSKIHINGSLGIGMSTYKYDVRYLNGISVQATDLTPDGFPITLHDKNNTPMTSALAGSFPVTMSVEYNISKPLAIGAKIHYRAFTSDNLEGVSALNNVGVKNDFVAAATLFLRVKFNASNKDHLRNIPYDVYEPDKTLALARELESKLNKLSGRVDTVSAKLNDLIPRVTKLENLLSNDGPDADGDGVPDVRDKDTNTKPNTPVDFWGKPLPVSTYYSGNPNNPTGPSNGGYDSNNPNSKRKAIYLPDDVPSLYFEYDEVVLDDAALITISKIAAKMKTDPTLYVEVRGYCDYGGSNPYNNLLSQRRSDRVKAELVKVWGIDFNHVISNGKGKVIEPRIKYKPNRRCDFFFGRL